MSFTDGMDGPWMVGGDFNVVKSLSEISGGHNQTQVVIDAFNLAVLDCSLEDVGFLGSSFTWINGHTWRLWIGWSATYNGLVFLQSSGLLI